MAHVGFGSNSTKLKSDNLSPPFFLAAPRKLAVQPVAAIGARLGSRTPHLPAPHLFEVRRSTAHRSTRITGT